MSRLDSILFLSEVIKQVGSPEQIRLSEVIKTVWSPEQVGLSEVIKTVYCTRCFNQLGLAYSIEVKKVEVKRKTNTNS